MASSTLLNLALSETLDILLYHWVILPTGGGIKPTKQTEFQCLPKVRLPHNVQFIALLSLFDRGSLSRSQWWMYLKSTRLKCSRRTWIPSPHMLPTWCLQLFLVTWQAHFPYAAIGKVCIRKYPEFELLSLSVFFHPSHNYFRKTFWARAKTSSRNIHQLLWFKTFLAFLDYIQLFPVWPLEYFTRHNYFGITMSS